MSLSSTCGAAELKVFLSSPGFPLFSVKSIGRTDHGGHGYYGVAWPIDAASRTEQGEKTVVLSTMLDGLVQRAVCCERACMA